MSSLKKPQLDRGCLIGQRTVTSAAAAAAAHWRHLPAHESTVVGKSLELPSELQAIVLQTLLFMRDREARSLPAEIRNLVPHHSFIGFWNCCRGVMIRKRPRTLVGLSEILHWIRVSYSKEFMIQLARGGTTKVRRVIYTEHTQPGRPEEAARQRPCNGYLSQSASSALPSDTLAPLVEASSSVKITP